MIHLNIVNGYFIYKYRYFYIQYKKKIDERSIRYTSFSKAIASVLPVEPTPEELKLVRFTKKLHTTFNVKVKKGKAAISVAVTIALLRAMARDMPEFKKVYEGDLRKLKEEGAE